MCYQMIKKILQALKQPQLTELLQSQQKLTRHQRTFLTAGNEGPAVAVDGNYDDSEGLLNQSVTNNLLYQLAKAKKRA